MVEAVTRLLDQATLLTSDQRGGDAELLIEAVKASKASSRRGPR